MLLAIHTAASAIFKRIVHVRIRVTFRVEIKARMLVHCGGTFRGWEATVMSNCKSMNVVSIICARQHKLDSRVMPNCKAMQAVDSKKQMGKGKR